MHNYFMAVKKNDQATCGVKYTKKDIDWGILDSILQFNATKPQCAAHLKTSEDTIDRRIKDQYNTTFSEYKETQMGLTKIKLQQKAIQEALSGNTTMLIFCLKNLVGWVDRQEVKTEVNAQVSTIEDFLKKAPDKKVID